MPPNTVATLSSLLPPEVVTAEYLRLRADRDTSLLAHPALHYAGDCAGRGSHTFKVPRLGLDGYRILEQVAEGHAVARRQLDDDEGQVTVAPWRKAYEFSDLAQAINTGLFSPSILARDSIMATANTLVHMLAHLVGSFTLYSGSSGAANTGLVLLAAKAKLSARSVPGPYIAILGGQQVEDFHKWLAETSGGGVQWMPATQEQLNAYGEGFQGVWGGIWIFLSNRVPTTNGGADSAGGMFGRGGVSWADSSFAPEPDPNIVDFGGAGPGGRGRVRFERERAGTAGNTTYITHAQLGMAIQDDGCGQSIITRAAA